MIAPIAQNVKQTSNSIGVSVESFNGSLTGLCGGVDLDFWVVLGY